MRSKCTDCGLNESIIGDELCEECREFADTPTPNPLIPAIERVIAEFESRRKMAIRRADYNASSDWEYAVNQLKEVLTNDIPTSNRQTSTSSTHDTTK